MTFTEPQIVLSAILHRSEKYPQNAHLLLQVKEPQAIFFWRVIVTQKAKSNSGLNLVIEELCYPGTTREFSDPACSNVDGALYCSARQSRKSD